MKIIKMSIMFLFVNMNYIIAQDSRTSEINVGYGQGTSTAAVYSFSSGFLAGDDDVTTTSGGAIHVSYKFALSKRFMLGLVYVNEKIDSERIEQPGNSFVEKTIARTNTFAVEADYRYIKKEQWQLYSGLGVGYTAAKEDIERRANTGGRIFEKESGGNFNCQLNLFGVRFGKQIAAFAEIGFGYKGFLNGGVSIQF